MLCTVLDVDDRRQDRLAPHSVPPGLVVDAVDDEGGEDDCSCELPEGGSLKALVEEFDLPGIAKFLRLSVATHVFGAFAAVSREMGALSSKSEPGLCSSDPHVEGVPPATLWPSHAPYLVLEYEVFQPGGGPRRSTG